MLCELGGRTHKEAARQLGCAEGAVSSRLSRARAMLANRLARYGLAVTAGALAAALAQNAASAAVPPLLLASTVRAAALIAADGAAAGAIPGKVVALTKGVLKAMLLSKLKLVAVVVAALAAVALGGGLLYHAQPTAQAAAPQASPAAKQGPSKDDETLKNTLLTLEKAWIASDGKPDTDTYGQFLADDFVTFTQEVDRVGKAEEVRAQMGHHVGGDYKMSDVQAIRINEKAAISTYKIEYKLYSNATGEVEGGRNLRYFTTWAQRGGGWVIVFAQSLVLDKE